MGGAKRIAGADTRTGLSVIEAATDGGSEACVDGLIAALEPYDNVVPGLMHYLHERKRFWSTSSVPPPRC